MRILYYDKYSSFAELLKRGRWDKVFKSGLSKLFKGCLPQNLLSPFFVSNISINNRNGHKNIQSFKRHISDAIFKIAPSQGDIKFQLCQRPESGTERVSFLVTKIFELVPSEFKENKSLEPFEFAIKNWQAKICPCGLAQNLHL